MKAFKTNNIFIDTSIFIQKNFDFTNTSFENLKSIVQSDNLNLFITSITENEVKNNIRLEVVKAQAALKKFRNEAKILWNVNSFNFKTLFKNKNLNTYESEITNQFDIFLKDCSVKYIDIIKANSEEVFKKYFEKKPPFKLGKKKDEFPDAFIIDALESWCDEEHEKIYVISDDSDFKDALKSSKKLLYIKSIEEYLDLFNKFKSDLPNKILDILDNQNVQDLIMEKITKSFQELTFWLNDEDGEVDDIEVEDVTIEDQYVIEATNSFAKIELEVKVEFTAMVVFLDADSSFYDKEEGKYLYKEFLHGKVHRSRNIQVSAEFLVDVLNNKFISIDNIDVNENQDVEMSANKYEEYFESRE